MENNELKEKIRKNIKEEIAISNIRKEFGMKTGKTKKLVYTISSICAVFILGICIFIGTSKLNNNIFQNNNLQIGETEDNCLDIELNINKLENKAISSIKADADVRVETIKLEQLSKQFMFIKSLIIPEEYKFENSYTVYIRGQKEIAEYNKVHDYILNYRKDDLNNIKIAFSEVEQPIRDYLIEGEDKISTINNVELKISQWKEMYIATFEYKDIYFDVETTGITEKQLVDLLVSIIENEDEENTDSFER